MLFFFTGFTIIAFISFLDDIYSLPSRYRLIFQFCGILLLLCQVYYSSPYSYWLFFFLSILSVGIVNAYNFMDGINGITGIYSLILIICLSYVNNFITTFIEEDFIITIILSVSVFLFFNFRKKAICFGGDVGSVGIAFLLVFFTGQLINTTYDWKYLFFFSIYGLDTIYTILFRLSKKQNIFEAHKLHFFQILVYQTGFSHLQVAAGYAISQLLLNIWIINYSASNPLFYLPILFLLVIMHFIRKKQGLAITIK
ncbi:UDP-GlcNAc--UDP-phosphate GlcNAc-1-phosphate transferase [Emticicia agri]|uniref:UDP-GlcNAc--UDP-phosphate GlcNAc-1-phosphate transferase n=1 Tax=Emticicia agri TaxID=2492393 RepID=UPI0021D01C4E|nr:UDP-GlcNAc--UDP-phosphate GlcNAc-1-phosphate transferase [Emticicia agri]